MAKHIHFYLKGRGKDANPDGTYSPDEKTREAQLKSECEAFARKVKQEAYKIGGDFRGPGIYTRMMQVLSKKV
jgi:hypothetical protein